MAYPPHYRLQFGGKLYPEESWSCGFAIANPPPTLLPDPDPAVLTALAGHLTTWVSAPSAWLSAAVTLEFVKLNKIGPDGNYVSETESFTHIVTPVVAATGSQNMPPQCSLVASLVTAAARGRGHAGRIYPPNVGLTVSGDGKVTDAKRLDVRNSTKALINSINGTMGAFAGAQVVVISSFGTQLPVTGVRVGRVIDTQRRRRKSMTEDYSTDLL